MMPKFLQTSSNKEPSLRRLAITYAALTFISLLFLWQQASQWVETRLKTDAQAQMVVQLDSIGVSLSQAINQRLAIINGLTAFSLTYATAPEAEIPRHEFETFAAGLQSGVTGIRDIAVAPDGIMRYVYPFEENKSVLGYEPLKDSRSNVREGVNRAIESRQVILSVPHELIQGGLGIIARQAVFQGDVYWGLTNIVADIPPLLEDAGLIPAPAEIDIAIRDQSGQVFFGEAAVFTSDPAVYTVLLPEGSWKLVGVPVGGWKTIYAEELAFFQAMGLLIVALLTIVTYLFTNRQERLTTLVQKRTGELAQSNNELQQELAERLKAERAMQESEQRVQQIMDTVPEGVCLLDVNGQIVLANPAAVNLLRVLADAGVGDRLAYLGERPLSDLLTPPPDGAWHEVQANGSYFELIAQATESGPMAKSWVLVLRDVTKEREIQQHVQEQDRLAAVGQLAAGIAHDFNNILAVIVLYTELTLQSPELPSKVRDRLDVIKQQSNRAADLVQQILDFSRRSVLQREIIDLAPFLQALSRLLERTLPETIHVEMDIQPGVYQANLDPTRIQQAVMNLAINARDAMSDGGNLCIKLASLQIEPGESPPLAGIKPGQWIRLSVTDTGTGIPAQYLPHIFDPFFTTKEVGKGSGLGLAQVYGIVKQHEGHIYADTLLGQGSTFTLYLPALSAPSSGFAAPDRVPVIVGQGQTILVVEDNAATRNALIESLEALNYVGVAASNGQEAITILERNDKEINLVLTDMIMPQMGGEGLLNELTQKGITTPVVLLSGYPVTGLNADIHEQGFADYLPKPVKLEQLAEVITRVMNQSA